MCVLFMIHPPRPRFACDIDTLGSPYSFFHACDYQLYEPRPRPDARAINYAESKPEGLISELYALSAPNQPLKRSTTAQRR